MKRTDFPAGFRWGVATSAFQIEGSPRAEGAGPSNWSEFCHEPNRIANGDHGDITCDHFRRWRDDLRLLVELGVNSYRFSLSWARILPEGIGRVNQRGLDFYSRLTDELLSLNITPCVTLLHWDLPASLENLGGWLNPEIPNWFAEYAAVVFGALDDRVPLWVTINEPWVVSHLGYWLGQHPPGHQNRDELATAGEHLLNAHFAAARVYRERGRHQLGWVVNLEPQHAASDREADLAAARRGDAYMNRQFLDPVLLGTTPDELGSILGPEALARRSQSLANWSNLTDFVGINYYSRSVVSEDSLNRLTGTKRIRQPNPHTAMDWEVYPRGLYEILTWFHGRYPHTPVYVTENGAAFDDTLTDDHTCHDPQRTEYLASHLSAAAEAMRQGVDLRGYFAWSFMDNFEWSYGYSKRFGLVHVDYATLERTIKSSGLWYREFLGGK
ncbi:MAG TPA: GH1 family beta-glucosidase [Pirellulaceae bacterium]